MKNAESGLAKSLSALPALKRVLLSGTPMQNELTEFFNMVPPSPLPTLSVSTGLLTGELLQPRGPWHRGGVPKAI